MKGSVALALLALLGMSACAGRSRPLPPPPVVEEAPEEAPYLEHRVRYSGESLALIAQWYTGKNRNWAAIKDANPGLKPERIRIGQRILIPRALLVKEQPLPQSFVRKGGGASGTKQPKEFVDPTAVPGAVSEEAPQEEASEEKAPAAAKATEQPSTPPAPQRAPAAAKQPVPSDDAERERLLDELLQ